MGVASLRIFAVGYGSGAGSDGFDLTVTDAIKDLKKGGPSMDDMVKSAVFHQPNGKFPVRAGKQLGFTDKQIDRGLLVREIGNTYSGAIMVGLCAIFDVAKPGDRIFAVGYGSGAGSDGFDLTVTDAIKELKPSGPTMDDMVKNAVPLDYATYAKFRGKIAMREAT